MVDPTSHADDPCDDIMTMLADARRVPEPYAPMIGDIQRAVAECFGIPSAEMKSPSRAREVARPRQVAMYLSRRLTARSLSEIGRMFGKRDHTTVGHAVRHIERLRVTDKDIDRQVRGLLEQFGAAA